MFQEKSEARNKKVLAIQEITLAFFKHDLSKYTLNFDDGLYSHYYYWDLIKKIDTEKTFYITTGAISDSLECREKFNGTYLDFSKEKEAIKNWHSHNVKEDFMTLGELLYLIKDGAIIGAHSHYHLERYGDDCFLNFVNDFKEDSIKMNDWFLNNLGFCPKKYACPYEKQHTGMSAILSNFTGIKKMEFGNETQKLEGNRYYLNIRKKFKDL